MRKIFLSQAKVALVDDEDYEELSKFKWCAVKIHRNWYAVRQIPRAGATGGQKQLQMQNMILPKKNGCIVDHKDRNGLNNQRLNLRYATYSQNRMNSRKKAGASSKYRGVFWNSAGKKWSTSIRHEGKMVFVGNFKDEKEAAIAYDKKVFELRGEEAVLNFQKI